MIDLETALALFRLGTPPLELLIRGTAMYWFLLLLFRFVLRRDAGSIGIADILLLMLIADASQNAMSGAYETIGDGVLLVLTIAGWNWLIDWAGYHFVWMRRLLEPPPVVLVRRGKLLRHNLRRELITTADLMAKLHEHGIAKLAEVKIARMESGGEISVIRHRG